MKMNKLKGLIATYKDSASTENEEHASYQLACRMIEKATGCKRWLSANVFSALVYGEVMFSSDKDESIRRYDKSLTKDGETAEIMKVALDTIGLKYDVKSENNHHGWVRTFIIK